MDRLPRHPRPRWQPSPAARDRELRHKITDWEQAFALLGYAESPPSQPFPPEEMQARALLGVPPHYPESVAAELPEAQEESLAALAASLWPEDQWAGIIQEFRS